MNEESEMRTSIYSYLAGYRAAFSLIWIGLTLIGMVLNVILEVAWIDNDSATQTYKAILVGIPVVWIASIVTALVTTEVYAMLKDLVGLDRKIERARAEERAKAEVALAQARAEVEAARAQARAEAEAEIARLKTRIDELERDR